MAAIRLKCLACKSGNLAMIESVLTHVRLQKANDGFPRVDRGGLVEDDGAGAEVFWDSAEPGRGKLPPLEGACNLLCLSCGENWFEPRVKGWK